MSFVLRVLQKASVRFFLHLILNHPKNGVMNLMYGEVLKGIYGKPGVGPPSDP